MGKLSLQAKLFIGACALALCVGALLAGVAKWSLERGFGRYLAQDEIAALSWFAEEAGRAYERRGGWDFLNETQAPWDRAIRAAARGIEIGALDGAYPVRVQGAQAIAFEAPAAGPRPPPMGPQGPGSMGPAGRPEAPRNDGSGFPASARDLGAIQPASLPESPRVEYSTAPSPPSESTLSSSGLAEQVSSANRPAMERIAEPRATRPAPDRARPGPAGPGPRLAPSPELSSALPRLRLLDASGAYLAGAKPGSRLSVSIPVPGPGGAAAGILELDPVESFDQRAMAFVAKQTQALWLGFGGALALSLLAAWAGSKHLTGPLRSLEAAAERIERGEFSARAGFDRGDELGALGRAFDAMAERIERAEQERQQWISDSSHELRTPLAVLRAEVEALQDGVRKPDEKSLARLHKNIMQMGKLVDDLRLSLDRADGDSSMHNETCFPARLAKEAGLDFSARYSEAGLALDILGLDKHSPAKVSGDPDRLRQVFVNVYENSARYTARGGRLVASAQVKSGWLRLQFDDTSPAPPDAALPKLFDRFYRADPSRSRELGGSGLGLAICKSIVEAHGGSVSASKSELGGLCLKITLPLEK